MARAATGSVFYNDTWMLSCHAWLGSAYPTRRPALAKLRFNPDGSAKPVMPIEAGRVAK